MIDKNLLRESVEKAIEGTDLFIVGITVSAQNNIVVELDSPGSLDIDTCAAVTRAIEKDFDRDVEDYDLEVGSAGLTAPSECAASMRRISATKSRFSPATAEKSRPHLRR